jgi:dTDP-L-rhamnose 4-epimerase
MEKSVLITGGGGMIGQALAKRHIAEGDDVYIFDKRLNPYIDYSNLLGKDFSEFSIQQIIENYKFDIISHQAALVSVGKSQYSPQDFFYNNVQFTAELLQVLIDTKNFPDKLMLAGSMGPYGEGNTVCEHCKKSIQYPFQRKELKLVCDICGNELVPYPTREGSIYVPVSFYAITKQTQENMFKVFSDTYKVDTTSLRYFSVYSSEANPNNPYTGVLSIIANKILNSDSIELYEDGEQARDLIHVDDVVDANFAAYSCVRKDGYNFGVFNVGTGKLTTLKNIAIAMKRQLNSPKEIKFNGILRAGDVRALFADTLSAKYFLNFEAKKNLCEELVKYCKFIDANRVRFTNIDSALIETKNLIEKGLIK